MNSYTNQQNAYRKASVNTLDQNKLIVMLYDGAIKQAGFDIKPTTQKLIGIELLKSHFGHDKYDNTLRQRLAPFGPLTLKYASLQYTVKVDTRLKEMLEKHHETNFDFINKLF